MENPREKAYSFSYCLFAYIYKDMHESLNLPVRVDYTVPSTKLFKSEIGECVLHVCRVHETFLKPVFSKLFPSISVSEEYFFEYVRWYYEKVACTFTDEYYTLYSKCNFEANPVGPFFIKLLTLCSFIAELVRYCFGKGCYSFTSSSPSCLAEIIITIPEFDEYFPSVTDAFIVLNRFCFDVMNDSAINANSLSDLFTQQSAILEENCSVSLHKNTLPTLNIFTKIADGTNWLEAASGDHHRHSNKRKSDALNGSTACETDCLVTESLESVIDSERCRKFSNNIDNFPERIIVLESDYLASESGMSADGRCPHCNEVCLMYLGEFVDDFRETNYDYEE